MQVLAPPIRLSPFVKDVILMNGSEDRPYEIPIYADGFPGVMYSETTEGIYLLAFILIEILSPKNHIFV